MLLELELAKVTGRLIEKGWKVRLRKSARELLIDKGFNKKMGARPLRRAVSKYLEDPLAEAVLSGRFDDGKVINVTAENDSLVFNQAATRKKKSPEKV